MSENLLLVKVGSNVLANNARTKLAYENFTNIAEDINHFERTNGGDMLDQDAEAHTILVSSGAFLAARKFGGVTNTHLEGLGAEELAHFKQQRIDRAAHHELAAAWMLRLGRRVVYSTIGELDLLTLSQRENIAEKIRHMLRQGIIGVYNNDDKQSLQELDDVVSVHGERYHIMADNDYTTLSIARLAVDTRVLGGAMDRYGLPRWFYDREHKEDTVVFLTHTNGVLEDVGRHDSTFGWLKTSDARQIADESLVHAASTTSNGGMYSKLHCAATIAEETQARVVIAEGKGRHALAKAIEGESGTEIVAAN